MQERANSLPVFVAKNCRRGFTVFFIFLVLLLVIFSDYFHQSLEVFEVGNMQAEIIRQSGEIRSRVDPRLQELMPESVR